ncbi:hypothetical protein GPECTOR_5g237 [Gonium pectorale]|uniref:Protein kinase domain-containing protein n=1 Tax=Gonium pectorale TaxID=33097 RepID=A0A150GW65_GONPE|nr:hypothetical protein GPECTOR_5g237 [Gonium pectorale]|eukprot:KXZ54137.1 hypothetical protein GPECTOR_5g237 [Gonium pectorale]
MVQTAECSEGGCGDAAGDSSGPALRVTDTGVPTTVLASPFCDSAGVVPGNSGDSAGGCSRSDLPEGPSVPGTDDGNLVYSAGSACNAGEEAGTAAASGAASAEADGDDADSPPASVPAPPAEQQLIVAVKRVPLGWNQERELMQLHRCQQCPFIVRLFGFVEDGTEHCSYVMEWAEGGDLGAMLASLKDRRGANKQRLLMSEASARYYFACLLLALDFMHSNGLLHRDIKPSNLLLTSDGTAKLADLGFTVALDANGTTVGCCGTTGYIAPEVYAYGSANGRRAYGVPADIWSAGATLFQILTGNVVTDSHEEVLKKGWRPPTHPHFSKPLQDLLNRMLAPKPTARPQSAASIMRHAWFAGFDWQALREGRMNAPYVPRDRRRTGQVAHGLFALAPGSTAGGSASSAFTGAAGSSGGPPTASPGGKRLPTVMERAPSQPTAQEGDPVVQRSAMSGRDEGSVKHGREGLLRDAPSFETVLPTVPAAEANASAFGPAAVPVAVAPDSSCSGPQGGSHAGHHGEEGRHHGGLTVRFAMGVAECA